MSENQTLREVQLSTQAFLVLCQLFDSCYDELKKHQELDAAVEGIAQSMLTVVMRLQEEQTKPKQLTLVLDFSQLFFLRKLVAEMLATDPAAEAPPKTRAWLEECLQALEHAVTP